MAPMQAPPIGPNFVSRGLDGLLTPNTRLGRYANLFSRSIGLDLSLFFDNVLKM